MIPFNASTAMGALGLFTLLPYCTVHNAYIWVGRAWYIPCTVLSLGGKVNTKQMSQPNIHFHIKNQWNVLFIGNYHELSKLSKLNAFILGYYTGTLMHLFLFSNTAKKENWFQCVHRECATAINFPCLITLIPFMYCPF